MSVGRTAAQASRARSEGSRGKASGGRLGRGYFERLYRARSDPWRFETSDYERRKYERTLAALDGRRPGRLLEVGCSIGVLTERLAEICRELLAVDIAPSAVRRARARLGGLGHVSVECRALPEELPPGPWDVIVCSEVLYYWSRPVLEHAAPALAGELSPGGALLAVHWRRPTRTYPLLGDEVHDLLAERLTLAHAHGDRTDDYRLDLYERR